jgi:CRP/FNR family transcriptional regulator, anaerobic regulatory protein
MLTNHLDELFAAYPVLSTLPSLLRETISMNAQRVDAPSGTLFFDVDAPCSLFLLVTQGSVRVFRPVNEREIYLYSVRRGQSCILTVSCLLGNSLYPARGIAEDDVIGYVIPRSVFIELLDRSADFRHLIFNLFSERITNLMTLIEEISCRRLDQRLAGLLAEGPASLETTHRQLADELGSVREVISRILKQFEKRGWVRLARGSIQIVDRPALAAFSDPLG